VPTSHKNLVRQFADSHGTPAITATHYEPGAQDAANSIYNDGEVNAVTILSTLSAPDAVDFYCYWKLWDALVDCALNGNNCDVAFGDTPQQRFMGNWSDGTPLTPLLIIPSSTTAIDEVQSQKSASVYPNPVTGSSFQLNLNNLQSEAVFQLFDVNGQQVANQKIIAPSANMKCALAPGIYFYQVINSTYGAFAKGKLVVL
jgi:hypothetical protein